MDSKKILIVDDEVLLSEFLEITFTREKYDVLIAHNIKDGYNLFLQFDPQVIIIDLKLPDGSGFDLLKKITERNKDAVIIVITAFGNIDIAVEAMRLGASDFISKPFSAEQISGAVEKSIIKKQNKIQDNNIADISKKIIYPMNRIIGNSREIQKVFSIINKIANTDTTVLITGESGTGKELVARYIHYHSDSNANPFITVNCNAIPDTLLESELFGHKKGSFTGAHADKIGLFEAADNGVIFLDEIGDISPTLQVKLLRVIEDKKIMRIGEVTSKKINVRIIAATNKDIEVEVKNGRFREDLFYRLNIIRIHLPPLRERGDDILMIANFFLENFKNQFNKLNIIGFSKDAIKEINNYSWPGNIRELENILKRAVILTENNEITASDLFGNIVNKFSYIKQSKIEEEDLIGDGIDLNEILEDLEKQYIIAALKKANNNQTEAAKLLNINRITLLAKIRKYSI